MDYFYIQEQCKNIIKEQREKHKELTINVDDLNFYRIFKDKDMIFNSKSIQEVQAFLTGYSKGKQ